MIASPWPFVDIVPYLCIQKFSLGILCMDTDDVISPPRNLLTLWKPPVPQKACKEDTWSVA